MKLLVLTSQPITAEQLREALGSDVNPDDTEVLVVAPALAESSLRFWFSDADDAIARAQEVRTESVRDLSEAGLDTSGKTGESDPIQAAIDALQTFPADRILVFAKADGEGQRYREDIDEAELSERVGLPVERATIG